MSRQRVSGMTAWALTLVAAAFLALPPADAAARVNYQACVAECEGAFPNVVESEASCAATLTDLHYDLPRVKEFLDKDYRCRGRYRRTCAAWKKGAIESLDRLIALTLDTSDCRKLDAGAIRAELAIFDTRTACRGDGKITDIHDLLGRKRSYLRKLNARGTRYKYLSERFSRGGDLGGREPDCPDGQRARRYYVWPLLQFYLALDGLGPYQSCMSHCKKPTPAQKRLWGVESAYYELRGTFERAEGQSGELLAARRTLSPAAGETPMCHAYTDLSQRMDSLRAELDEVERDLLAYLGLEKPPLGPVQQLEAQLGNVEDDLNSIRWEHVRKACADEDRRADTLAARKRAILESLTLGEQFSLKAVDTFDGRNGRGESCAWTGDCRVPLLCTKGTCQGELTPASIGGLLDEAEDLRAKALKLQIRSASGLKETAEKQVAQLEEDYKALGKRLQEMGWVDAVDEWRGSYRDALETRFQALDSQLQAAIESALNECSALAPDLQEGCEEPLEELEEFREELTGIREALGQADPIGSPRWVRLKVKDLAALEEEAGAALAELDRLLETPADTGPPVLLFAGIGAAVVVVLALAGLVLWRRRRQSRAGG